MKTQILNENEKNVLIACKNEIVDCTGCEFGLTSDIKLNDLKPNEIKGYLSQLKKKGFITIFQSDDDTQVSLTILGCDFLLSITQNELEIKEINIIKENAQ